jgi:hypothetical protein
MKSKTVIYSLFILINLIASCALIYNPDFVEKLVVNDSGSTDISGSPGDVIGPGIGTLSGKINSYFKTSGLYVKIDTNADVKAVLHYPDWSFTFTNLPCGPHTFKLVLKDADGKELKSKSFTYNVPAYIATNGSDANTGNSPTNALLTIQNGVNLLPNGGYVFAGEGTNIMSSAIIINKSGIKIYGGWDGFYKTHTNQTVLWVQSAFISIMAITGCSNILVDGFLFLHSDAAGLNLNYVTNSHFSNISVISTWESCGVRMNACFSNYMNANVLSNYAWGGDCGGIYISGGESNTIDGLIANNSASGMGILSGGGIYMKDSMNNNIRATIRANNATYNGGGIFISGGSNNLIAGDILSNSCNSNGCGVFISNSDNNTFSGNISFNSNAGSGAGGGIYLYG